MAVMTRIVSITPEGNVPLRETLERMNAERANRAVKAGEHRCHRCTALALLALAASVVVSMLRRKHRDQA